MEPFQQHHNKFSQFLGPTVQQSKTTAREKLVKLSKNQFSELSTDVFDELNRRELESDPFLPVNEQYHPKRNQARQKLATLQLNRFKELCGDVMSEIERRYPSVKAAGINFSNLDNLVAEMGVSVQDSMFGLNEKRSFDRDAYPKAAEFSNIGKAESIKSDNSLKREALRQMAALDNDNAQIQNLSLRLHEKDQQIVELLQTQQKQKVDFDSSYRQLSDKHESLKKDYNTLQEDYNEQQQILNDIRTEASNLLQEIKSLSGENQFLKEENSKFKKLVDDLKRDTSELERQRVQQQRHIDSMQSQIEQLKQQNRESERGTGTLPKKPIVHSRTIQNIDYKRDGIYESSAYKIARIQPYVIAVDQLMSETRNQREPSTNVLVAMRSIVLACKTITEDCDAFERNNLLAPLDKEALTRIKQQLSSCLTKQMQIAKECATTASEASAKSIFDSSCALTSVVVDLITTVNRIIDQSAAKRQPTPTPLKSNYSLDELKIFLEEQTDSIVQSIQKLLEQLRLPRPTGELDPIVTGISQIVSTIIQISTQTFERTPDPMADDIIHQLGVANANLIQSSHDLQSNLSVQSKQQVASHSYEIAKFVKQLIGLLE